MASEENLPLTPNTRVEAAHWLRGFDEHVLEFIRALSPKTGMSVITDMQYDAQIDSLIAILERIRHLGGIR